MKIDWKPEALGAAFNEFRRHKKPRDGLRAAIETALCVQGFTVVKINRAIQEGYDKGRAEAFEEAAAFIEGKGGVIPGVSAFARLLSRNNQPCMSGDARDRLNRLDRRAFDEATDALASAIRALAEKEKKG